MENDELHRLDLLSFDEKTETWFLDTREARRLPLSRPTLEGLVQLYNSIHRGSPLQLSDRRDIERLEESHHRLSETIRDLYLHLDRHERRKPSRLLLGALRQLAARFRR
jgi:hypothetical protein